MDSVPWTNPSGAYPCVRCRVKLAEWHLRVSRGGLGASWRNLGAREPPGHTALPFLIHLDKLVTPSTAFEDISCPRLISGSKWRSFSSPDEVQKEV